MPSLDHRALRFGVFSHGAIVLAASTPLARGSGTLDALGLLLLAAATAGYASARLARPAVDAAHTAFVAGGLGGLVAAGTFTVGVVTDSAGGAFFSLHAGLATAGLPGWLVAEYGLLVVLGAGFVLCSSYAFAALAGGAVAVGDLFQVGGPDGPRNRR